MDYQSSSKMSYSTSPLLLCLFILLFTIFPISNVIALGDQQINYGQLEGQYSKVASEIFQYYSRIKINGISRHKNISDLEAAAKKYLDKGDAITTVSLLLLNQDLIKKNINDRSVLFFISTLLDNNELNTPNQLHDLIKNEGEKSLQSNASYIFAKHYFLNNEWKKCLDYTADIYADLPDEDANNARLISGVSLQNLKEHRKAVELYKKIPVKSAFYKYARLNMAVAYIRQGWWTDARNVIDETLKLNNADTDNDEIINRLYLVLGYSLLQKEYYRDSREAFRNINANSQYANRALLGIGLASANQGDYIGALNALSILKDKPSIDLSVDESYLLFPFVYKKLGQQMTASTAYNEAIEYYQMRIDTFDKLKIGDKLVSDIINSTGNQHEFVVNTSALEYGKNYSPVFLQNLRRIRNLGDLLVKSNNDNARNLIKKINKLKLDYDQAHKTIIKEIVMQRREFINSYLNQSRYGLASLYDNDSLSDN